MVRALVRVAERNRALPEHRRADFGASTRWTLKVKLSPAAFNRHIAHMGQRMLWRQAFACPCIQEHSGAAASDCPICKGKGRMWNAAIEGVAGVTQQQVNPSFQDFGTMEQGDLTLSVPSDSVLYGMGRFDRVTLLNSTDVFSRTLTRGANDQLSDLTAESITRVFWLNPAGDAIVEGGIPAVSSSGVLTWASGEPAAGVQYSITGRRFSDYFVWEHLPSNRNEHMGVALPKKVQIRLFDLYGR